jgi:hypothetical protein
MNAILFQLKKLNENQSADQGKWHAAKEEIWQLQTTAENIFCGREGYLLIRDGNASPLLAKAISSAASRNLAYSLTFFDGSTEWNFDPKPVSVPPN